MKAFSIAFLALLTTSLFGSLAIAAETSDSVISGYTNILAALAKDDLATAKNAATALADTAKSAGNQTLADKASALSNSNSLQTAREQFKALSEEVTNLAQGSESKHAAGCQMADQCGQMMKMMQRCGQTMSSTKGCAMMSGS